MTEWAETLLAISTGAVFMGRHDLHRQRAQTSWSARSRRSAGVPMPSFFGYMLWSVAFLVPLFVVITAIFFADGLL